MVLTKGNPGLKYYIRKNFYARGKTMSKVNFKVLMDAARKNNVAVPAFNIDNLESAIAVSEVMKETGLGIIVQTIPRTLAYGGLKTYPNIMNALMENSNVDYCLHLDHGNSVSLCLDCAKSGFTSVMIDGSALTFDENIALTKKVVSSVPNGVTVEAELGAIGGKEETEGQIKYTDPDEAADFVKKTGCDSLAIGVGTAHGVYKGEPLIRVDLIEKIKSKTDALLVLHGASGLKDEVIKDCIKAGISKINFATELRQAYTAGIKNAFLAMPDCFDPKIYMRPAIDEIKKVILHKIQLCMNI